MWVLSTKALAATFLFVVMLGLAFYAFSFFSNKTQSQPLQPDQEIFVGRSNEHYLSYVPDATYTIVEYFDFDCIFCRRLHLEMDEEFIDYSKVNYILRSFPVTDVTLSAYKSLIAECVYLQSGDTGYISFLDQYYKEWGIKNQFDWVLEIAGSLVGDEMALEECISTNEVLKNNISTNYSLDAVSGISSTPTFVVYKDGVLENVYRGLGLKLYLSLISYYSK